MAIPQSFLDELTARCPIEEVVSDYLPLHAKGGNLWGLCPFHGEDPLLRRFAGQAYLPLLWLW